MRKVKKIKTIVNYETYKIEFIHPRFIYEGHRAPFFLLSVKLANRHDRQLIRDKNKETHKRERRRL